MRSTSRVAVFQQPSADWVCSLLAIWRAGGTYIPMDLRNPIPRLAAIAKAAKPTVILCQTDTEGDVKELSSKATVINVSNLGDSVPVAKIQAKANTAATILFTSGSTGTPKGVILHHSALRNTIEGFVQQYDIGAEKVLQQSAFTFDLSLDQILCGLVNGGSVFVATKENRVDPAAIASIVKSERITYTHATPSEYSSWITYGPESLMNAADWSFAFGGGETMPLSLRDSIESLGLEGLTLYNSYGPAESITCTKIKVQCGTNLEDDTEAIPVGYPLPNYSVYVVDRNLELVPQGVTGEILIGGPSVANGYLNDERLSSRHFVSNPWGNGVVYRTGDVGYFREDSALMFRGRVASDTQVKLRGIRIDLKEIESCIIRASEGALDIAIVSIRPGDILVAHIKFCAGEYTTESEQKAFLQNLRFLLPLPVYMVPAVFVPVERMPMNAHNKTDRKAVQALPLPQTDHGRTGEALSEMERTLLEVWKEVVPAEMADVVDIGSQTGLFELGGNSLLLVKLQSLVNKRFDVGLSLIDLFGAASLGAMAARIEAARIAEA